MTTDAGYRFEQRVHGRWKSVPVRGRDTGRIVLGAGERDTLRLNFRREIGYDPIGFCRIGKTFADVSGTRARFDRMCEAETRSRIIDWKRVDLIPDTIRPDGRFVEMTAEVEGASVLVTVFTCSGVSSGVSSGSSEGAAVSATTGGGVTSVCSAGLTREAITMAAMTSTIAAAIVMSTILSFLFISDLHAPSGAVYS